MMAEVDVVGTGIADTLSSCANKAAGMRDIMTSMMCAGSIVDAGELEVLADVADRMAADLARAAAILQDAATRARERGGAQ